MPPAGTPIGLQLAHSAKHVARAFNDALAGVGGSMPTWFILTNLKGDEWRTQHELARALHIEGPTLTRHLDGLEEEGLVVRRRDPHDRRAVSVELTEAGRAKHADMLRAGLNCAALRIRAPMTCRACVAPLGKRCHGCNRTEA